MYGNICRQDGGFGVFSDSHSKTNRQVSYLIVFIFMLLKSEVSSSEAPADINTIITQNTLKFRV